MKIYSAAIHPPDLLNISNKALLSFYDIYISTIPFRKETFNYIKTHANKQRRIKKSPGNSKTRTR